MPILNVYHARSVIVLKRSMSPGFAGVDNELYFDQKTSMLFGDAKSSVAEITEELKVL
jgi:NAD(P) transhydrogenase subunit beta